MSGKVKLIKLNNGVEMPQLGLGVWRIPNHKVCQVVKWALGCGYRHIDTAKVYGNEEGVGQAIIESGIPRKDIFVTTKLGIGDILRPQKAFEESLARLKLDYVDLYLIHWPMIFWQSAWKTLEEIYKSGKARAIGVSNFNISNLEELRSFAQVLPAVNQVEISPFLQRRKLVKYCHESKIVVESYSPLTHGRRLADPTLLSVAKKYDKTAAQILIRWGLHNNFVVIPKSHKKEHIEKNVQVFDFKLTHEDMEKLDALDENSSMFPLWSRG